MSLGAATIPGRQSRSYQLGLAGLVGVVLIGTVLAISVAGTGALLPETLRPGKLPPEFLGLLGRTGIHLGGWLVVGALTALFFSYVLAVRAAEQLPTWMVLSAIGAFVVVVLIAPPTVSTDAFSYQAYAQMYKILGSNPYLHGPNPVMYLQSNPLTLYPYIDAKWIGTPSVYGPVFTLLSTLWAGSLRESTGAVAASVFAYKTIAAVSAVGTMALLWHAAKLREVNPVRTVALFGLNPLVVFYGIGGGHNDLMTVLLSTAGVYALLAHRNRAAGSAVTMAAGIKLTAGLILPFALASSAKPDPERRRRSLVIGTAITAVCIGAAGFVAFGSGMLHLPTTLSQVQNEGAGQTIPGFISTILRLNTLGHAVGVLLGLLFIGLCVWLLLKVYRDELDWIEGAAWATVGLLVSTSSILPWYGAWMLPLIGLCSNRKLWNVGLAFTGWIMLTTLLGSIPGPSFLGL
jgi:alpha-1,6-mannosyltransferase